MEEIKERKRELRDKIRKMLGELSDKERQAKTEKIEEQLFGFANFMESNVSLLYADSTSGLDPRVILKRCLDQRKIVVLPAFDKEKFRMELMKVDSLDADMKRKSRGFPEPDERRCKKVPVDRLDIAIIPGLAFDEKGSRIGSGEGYYDRFIPQLSATTRKVALAFEEQIVQQVPMQSHDKHVDIVITDERIIYKI